MSTHDAATVDKKNEFWGVRPATNIKKEIYIYLFLMLVGGWIGDRVDLRPAMEIFWKPFRKGFQKISLAGRKSTRSLIHPPTNIIKDIIYFFFEAMFSTILQYELL